MLHATKRQAKALIERFAFGRQFLRRRHYRTELALLAGTHENRNDLPSVIHFGFNKSASQFIKALLRRCGREVGMVPVAIHDYAFNTDFPFLDHLSAREMRRYEHVFKPRGYVYSAFGGMVEGIANLDEYKIVLVIRDPRDILVSGYFSVAFSHNVPDSAGNKHAAFMHRRATAKDSTIDEYAIANSDRLLAAFNRYESLLLDRYDNVHTTTFEQLATDFEGWLRALVRYCDWNLDEAFIRTLCEENERRKPKREDSQAQRRKGQPGDFREKLKQETIRDLDRKFGPTLTRFGYE